MPSPRPRPIIFSGPMVRAITRETDQKTQTRRPVTGMALTWLDQFLPEFVADPANHLSPYGHAGDQLWVRETFWGDATTKAFKWYVSDVFTPDRKGDHCRLVPSIHMPREACRLHLDVVAVRIERLLAISVDDCFAEGIEPMRCPECHLAAYGLPGWGHEDLQKTPPEAYWHLWDKLNERRGYGRAKNPWLWVIEFRRANG